MDWEIREAVPEDAPCIAAGVEELLGEIMTATGQPHFHFDREATRARTADWLRAGTYRSFLARKEREVGPLGLINVTEAHALYAGGAFGLVPEFYVRPEWRSQGVGRELLNAVRRLGREREWGRLELTTPPLPAFERTYAFYEREGLTVAGGRKMKLAL
ncbi:hypothetical protein AN478_10725 [Thiohalorhabdus denitrificans]|uniref:Ribosomal protein S18 acetylase RimI n=1 Tax=Thiohalorhabdus denitrificans TaxID=381306 RepID=A0A0N8PMT2_9GAMM|nr:GNAT family N-acetyltransferase [Thiohalorhabdus denitrificans]KPV39597.1 hypothetical protein AN478_10725 [Thiohalorhabdus denitrificans]SCX97229.1 Ribosomal protein S18 acetylase RimI [Thiohalorhabdus denitrificans]